MIWIFVAILIVALVFGPSLWAKAILSRHSQPRPDFPGTGGELARHLLDEGGLGKVAVEISKQGDHYDPQDQAVRLTEANYEGRSLTAVVVAAHEVGHALQDRDGYAPLRTRTHLIRSVGWLQRLGSATFLATSLIALFARTPGVALIGLGAGLVAMASEVVVHLVTLPVELDASFNRALPILDKEGYLPKGDLPHARKILQACALTYVAASLTSLLNLWRWIRYLR